MNEKKGLITVSVLFFLLMTMTAGVLTFYLQSQKTTYSKSNAANPNKNFTNIEYSWINKFPLATDKYHVNFDPYEEVFIGKIFPERGENIDNLKNDIIIQMQLNGIPVRNYNFKWVIEPRNI